MASRRYSALGVLGIAAAALLWAAGPGLARKGGGGGHGGGGGGHSGGGGGGRSFSGSASHGGASSSAARSFSSGFSGGASRYSGSYSNRSNFYRPYYRHYFPGFFGFYGFYDPWFYSSYYPYFGGGPWYPLAMTYGPSVAQLQPYLSDMLAPPPPLADDDMVHLRLKVPAGDAEVWFENQRTQQVGAQRDFDSPSLTPGKTYTYEVRVRWSDNGREKVDTRKLFVRAGERLLIDFTQPPPPERLMMPKAKN